MPIQRGFRFLRSRAQIADEVDAELEFHLEMRAAELVRQGLDPSDARRNARSEFGDLEFTRVYCRELDQRAERATRLADRLEAWGQDLWQAWRTVLRHPGFALTTVLTLGIALGANTAIFTVVRSVLLRPLPYPQPEQLVRLSETDPADPAIQNPLSPLNLLDYRAAQRSLAGLGGYDARSVTWRPADGDPELLDILSVTPNLFEILRVPPLLGRALSEAEDGAGGEPRTVLSYGLWQSAFGGRASVLGHTITLNDLPYRIVGVMPRGFTVSGREAMWAPLSFQRERATPDISRRQHDIPVIGRLRPGVSLKAAEGDLARISRDLARQYPDANTGRIATLTPLARVLSGDVGPALVLLQLASALVLLIACVNLANLTLARGIVRRREFALRAALGAGQGRLLHQLLAESTLLALVGGAFGTGLALLTTRMLLALEPGAVPPSFQVHADATVLLFGLGLSLVTGLGFGILPALAAARPDLRKALQEGGRGSGGPESGSRIRRALVVAQVALAVVLLTSAGLLIRSFVELTRVPLGFDPDHVLTAEVRVSGERYDPPVAVNGFYDRMLDEIRSTPGVVAVGATMKLPGKGMLSTSLRVEGAPDDANRPADIGLVLVRGDYVRTLGVPLLAGRLFGPEDRADAPGAVLLNQAAVRAFFGGGEAVGRRIRYGPDPHGPWSTVVGVIGDLREEGVELAPRPVMYASHVQNTWWRSLTVVVRTSGDPAGAEPAIRRALRLADPLLALRDVRTFDAVLGGHLAARRLVLTLVTGFAGVALLLAAVGIYGVLAFSVTSRTREFGVRLALGAERRNVLLMVLREGLVGAMAGLGAGVALTLALGQVLRGRLYGIAPTDGLTLAAVAIGLLGVAGIASLLPALRATRVDPVESLRAE